MMHDDWSDLAAERLDKIEELTDKLSTLVDERDQANAAVARLLNRAEIAEKRLAMVRGTMQTATDTIAKLQAELDRFELVMTHEEAGDVLVQLVEIDAEGKRTHLRAANRHMTAPVTLYRKGALAVAAALTGLNDARPVLTRDGQGEPSPATVPRSEA